MEQLIELLQQIQDLAGAGIDALKGAAEGGDKEAPPEKGAPPAEGGGMMSKGGMMSEKGAPPA